MSKTREANGTKRIGIGAIMTASALTLGACSDGGNTTQTGAICTSLPPLAQKTTYKVGFSQLYEENGPWRNANTKSIMDEAAKRGYELVYNPGTRPDASEQVSRMQDLINAKVDVIIIAPHDETILAPSIVAARRACIPVFIEDRSVDPAVAIPGVDYVAYLGSDFRKEGELTADWLIAKTGGQARIIELEGTIGSSPGVQRKQGFDARIAGQTGMSILVSQRRASGSISARITKRCPSRSPETMGREEVSSIIASVCASKTSQPPGRSTRAIASAVGARAAGER